MFFQSFENLSKNGFIKAHGGRVMASAVTGISDFISQIAMIMQKRKANAIIDINQKIIRISYNIQSMVGEMQQVLMQMVINKSKVDQLTSKDRQFIRLVFSSSFSELGGLKHQTILSSLLLKPKIIMPPDQQADIMDGLVKSIRKHSKQYPADLSKENCMAKISVPKLIEMIVGSHLETTSRNYHIETDYDTVIHPGGYDSSGNPYDPQYGSKKVEDGPFDTHTVYHYRCYANPDYESEYKVMNEKFLDDNQENRKVQKQVIKECRQEIRTVLKTFNAHSKFEDLQAFLNIMSNNQLPQGDPTSKGKLEDLCMSIKKDQTTNEELTSELEAMGIMQMFGGDTAEKNWSILMDMLLLGQLPPGQFGRSSDIAFLIHQAQEVFFDYVRTKNRHYKQKTSFSRSASEEGGHYLDAKVYLLLHSLRERFFSGNKNSDAPLFSEDHESHLHQLLSTASAGSCSASRLK